jgi:hypothetical protein
MCLLLPRDGGRGWGPDFAAPAKGVTGGGDQGRHEHQGARALVWSCPAQPEVGQVGLTARTVSSATMAPVAALCSGEERPEKGGEAPVGSHALGVLLGPPQGSPRWSSHGCQRRRRRGSHGRTAPVVFGSSRDTQSVEEEEAKARERAIEHGEGQRRGDADLGWLGNGGARRRCRANNSQSERGRAERSGGNGEGKGEGVLVPLLIGSRAQGAWPKVGRAAAVEAHGGHVHSTRRRSGISPNTCHASLCLTRRPFLGLLGSEFGHELRSKVGAHSIPYNFH